MQVLRAVLLRSPVALGGVLIAVVEIILALSRHTVGFNLWTDRVAGLNSASILVGVVAAGAAAVEANRWENANRSRMSTAARSRLLSRTQHAMAVLVPLFAGYWIAVVVIAVQASLSGTFGTPSLLWLITLSFAIVFAGSIGYAAGVALPYRWFVGPAVGVGLYVCYVALIASKLPYGVVSLFPASGNYDSVFTRTVIRTLVAEAVFFVAGSILVLLLTGLRRRTTARALTALVAVAVILVAAGALNVSTNGQVTSGHNPGVFVCAGTRPQLCLNPGYSRALAALHKPFHRLDTIADGTPLAAARLEQNVQGVGDDPSHGSRSVYLEQWAAPDDLTFSVYRYVQKYGGSSHCTIDDDGNLEADVDSWLSGFYESTAGADADAASARLARLSTAQGAEWFQKHYSQYATCKLVAGDLP